MKRAEKRSEKLFPCVVDEIYGLDSVLTTRYLIIELHKSGWKSNFVYKSF